MLLRHRAYQMDDLRSELDGQDREDEKAHKAPRENSSKEVREAHFKGRCCQHEKLERGGRRKHCGEHDGPELVTFERSMDLREPLFRDALAENRLSTKIPDGVNDKTTQGGSSRGQHNVEKKM